MAFTEIYVDPSLNSDTGAGTVGDPYGDLEFAIEQETFDTTNGTRVNIKAGTDEVLAAGLETALADTSVSAAWVPTVTAKLVFQGYTATAGDGGIGGISGGGSVGIVNSATLNYIYFVDCHLHSCGAAVILDMNDGCGVFNCELNDTTNAGITLDNSALILKNYVHNIGTIGIQTIGAGTICRFNRVVDGANEMTIGIQVLGDTLAERNIISLSGNGTGISTISEAIVNNNSIYSSTASTGTGISNGNNVRPSMITNNLVEGFSGAGGKGIDFGTSAGSICYGGNSVFNCTTAFTAQTLPSPIDLGGNETLSASPFADAANGDFSPVNTGSVKEGHLPASFP